MWQSESAIRWHVCGDVIAVHLELGIARWLQQNVCLPSPLKSPKRPQHRCCGRMSAAGSVAGGDDVAKQIPLFAFEPHYLERGTGSNLNADSHHDRVQRPAARSGWHPGRVPLACSWRAPRAREARSTSDHLPPEAAPAESSGRSLETGEPPGGPAMPPRTSGRRSPNIWRTLSRLPPM
jgi:hypothetical protein